MVALLMAYWFDTTATHGIAPRSWILALLLIPGIFVSLNLRRQALRATLRKWAVWVFYIESIFTLWVSYLYFSGPMHDIALDYFGHHGRFGVVSLNGTSSSYLIHDITLPLILFSPPIVSGILYFGCRRKGKKKDDRRICDHFCSY